ncbi:MAG TPA: tryptophan 2,3-dioxygenase family protein [Bacteroidota bacterium]|nr:tryptophan 2,3-dioxygenase family protein [Bacteroidota bacterium]
MLGCQHPESARYGQPAHDEMLFIIVHQAYELWFKQILYELEAIINAFRTDAVDERQVHIAVHRLSRIAEIQKLLLAQIKILETMTPLDFLEFRDLLYPASGFQSYQFRLVENRMGVRPSHRHLYRPGEPYYANLSPEHQRLVQQSENEPSLFDVIEAWLERTPFLNFHGFDFLGEYEKAVRRSGQELRVAEAELKALLDDEEHEALRRKNKRRMSRRAMVAALFISLYRDEPIIHPPFQLLTALIEMDELFTAWRYNHALMVQRMIGTKTGTGGSSGYEYLKGTLEPHKVFSDLLAISTYLIPRSELPALPEELKRNLAFWYTVNSAAEVAQR